MGAFGSEPRTYWKAFFICIMHIARVAITIDLLEQQNHINSVQ